MNGGFSAFGLQRSSIGEYWMSSLREDVGHRLGNFSRVLLDLFARFTKTWRPSSANSIVPTEENQQLLASTEEGHNCSEKSCQPAPQSREKHFGLPQLHGHILRRCLTELLVPVPSPLQAPLLQSHVKVHLLDDGTFREARVHDVLVGALLNQSLNQNLKHLCDFRRDLLHKEYLVDTCPRPRLDQLLDFRLDLVLI